MKQKWHKIARLSLLAVFLFGCTTAPSTKISNTPVLALERVTQTPENAALPTEAPTSVPSTTPTASLPATTVPAGCQIDTPTELTHGELQDVALSPDGLWLITSSLSGVHVHDAASLGYDRTLLQETPYYSVAISPDGQILAAGGLSQVVLVDLATGQELDRVGEEFEGMAQRLAFTSDGNWLAAPGWGYLTGAVRLWNLADHSRQERNFSTYGSVTSLAFSPDGRILALGTDMGRVELFDWESSARLAILAEPQEDNFFSRITDLDFSPDGNFLAAVGESPQGLARVWSLKGSKRIVESHQTGFTSIRPYVAFIENGERLLSGMGDLAIAWERSSGEQVATLWGYSSMPLDLELSPDGERIAWVTAAGLTLVYPLSEEGQNLALAEPGGYHALNVTFATSKNVVVGLYNYGIVTPDKHQEMIRMWNAMTGESEKWYTNASAPAFPPRIQNTLEEEVITLVDTWGKFRIQYLANEGGLCLPGCTCDPSAGFVKPESCFQQLPYGLSPLKLRYSLDGTLVAASGVADGWSAALLWDPAAGEERAWFPGGHSPTFAPDRKLIAIPVDEINTEHTVVTPTLVLYDYDNRTVIQRSLLPASGRAVFSPSGEWLAIGLSSLENTNTTGQYPPDSQKNGLMFWDVSSWEQAAYFPVTYGIVALDHTHLVINKMILAAATEIGRILIWDPAPCGR